MLLVVPMLDARSDYTLFGYRDGKKNGIGTSLVETWIVFSAREKLLC